MQKLHTFKQRLIQAQDAREQKAKTHSFTMKKKMLKSEKNKEKLRSATIILKESPNPTSETTLISRPFLQLLVLSFYFTAQQSHYT